MRYTEMVKEIASRHNNITQEMVRNVLQTLVAVAEEELSNGGYVIIDNLLRIDMKEQKGRKGVIRLGEKAGQTFHSPDIITPKVRVTPRFKKRVSKEV